MTGTAACLSSMKEAKAHVLANQLLQMADKSIAAEIADLHPAEPVTPGMTATTSAPPKK